MGPYLRIIYVKVPTIAMVMMRELDKVCEKIENMIGDRINSGYSNLIQEVNECLNKIMQSTIYNAEHLERSIKLEISDIKHDFSTQSSDAIAAFNNLEKVDHRNIENIKQENISSSKEYLNITTSKAEDKNLKTNLSYLKPRIEDASTKHNINDMNNQLYLNSNDLDIHHNASEYNTSDFMKDNLFEDTENTQKHTTSNEFNLFTIPYDNKPQLDIRSEKCFNENKKEFNCENCEYTSTD